jgi:hypothetical protein
MQITEAQEPAASADDNRLSRFFPPQAEECRLTICCRPSQYSASVIARAVEDCDAHLINLNVTADKSAEGDLVVDLRINHRHGEAVARSLERYGYDVVSINGGADDDPTEELARERIGELLHYLNI